MSIDLNSDLGESFGVWRLGDDEPMLDVITSANVACGFHAGDPTTLRDVCSVAARRGVAIGAQVSYPDLAGFGRRYMAMEHADLRDAVIYQIGALQAFAAVARTSVRYVKPHGALYHAVRDDPVQAAALIAAVAEVDETLIVMSQPGSKVLELADRVGVQTVREAFVDRAYRPDGSLVPRSEAGSVLTDVDAVLAQALQICNERRIVAVDGTVLPMVVESMCVHGDTPGAVELATAVRRGLEAAGVTVAPFTR